MTSSVAAHFTRADAPLAGTRAVLEPSVTIVMYHYVRDLARSRFPRIKGLDVALFREQLGYILRHYTVITAESLMAAVQHQANGGRWELPRNACLLTFDDGYTDHFRTVFPLLDEAGVQGSFFPSASAVLDRRVLDVNKIHFILASVPDVQRAIADLHPVLDRYRGQYALPDTQALCQQFAHATRYDDANVVFFKRLLQSGLPAPLRSLIVGELFARYVTTDERAFAAELYADLDELRCMERHGMYIGSHADTHQRLEHLSRPEQEVEIDRSLALLSMIGTPLDAWVMCYPYGSFNETLSDILRARGCALGLTTHVDIASAAGDPMCLARLDTTDLPVVLDAAPNDWTLRVT